MSMGRDRPKQNKLFKGKKKKSRKIKFYVFSISLIEDKRI